MKNNYLVVITLILGVMSGLALSNLVAPSAVTAADSKDDEQRRIHVSGSGEVKADPDQVEISMGVEVTRTTAQEAREENAAMTNQVINSLRGIGVSRDHIETVRFTIFPEREYDEETRKSEVVGYRAVNIIKVTSEDTDMAARIIDTAVSKGANSVEDVSFTLQEPTRKELRKEAVKYAVDDAQSEAQNAAREMGINLGPPITIDVTSGFQPFEMRYEFAGAKGELQESTPIVPGKVTVRANINVAYSFT